MLEHEGAADDVRWLPTKNITTASPQSFLYMRLLYVRSLVGRLADADQLLL
jgi:hypothetical protein